MKRQRDREYYARNKDDILKRRREAREKKQASTALLNVNQNVPHTPLAMSQDVDPKELHMQMEREQYSQNMGDVLKRERQAYSERKMSVVSADIINVQENETQTPVSMSIDPKELRRQRDRERYAQNRDEILKRQRLSREKRKATTGLLNDDNTVSQTPATGQSVVTQLQKLTCAVTGLSNIQNSSHERVPHNKENNLTYDDESNWLHRNDAYQMQQIPGSSKRAIAMPLGQKMQLIGTIIRDIAQGHLVVCGW